ncbi:MAG TPA: S41 family peptidase [Bryobacteraceae bacterium]|nr:S41 family peptidase [Bryobacteraceae bacterium]
MRALFLFAVLAVSAVAQNLTLEQKQSDFRHVVNVVNNWYAPLDWKKQVFGVDGLDLKSWQERIARTKTDLEYYELLVEYTASLQDSHTRYSLPSDFVARLGLTLDVFEGKVLIESINRTLLPMREFPFAVGDEVLAVDGVPVEEVLARFRKYGSSGHPQSTLRMAAAYIALRPQSVMPHASQLGDSSTFLVRRAGGEEGTYTLEWIKTGTPLEVGAAPTQRRTSRIGSTAAVAEPQQGLVDQLGYDAVPMPEAVAEVLAYGARNPVFFGGLGNTFTRRMGGAAMDQFFSGVFRHDGLNIGFLRIPTFSPASAGLALQQLDREIVWMQENTDGLIVDVTRNPGGAACFREEALRRFSPHSISVTGYEMRAQYSIMMQLYSAMLAAKATNAGPVIIQEYERIYEALAAANRESRGLTEVIPLCTSSLTREPVRDPTGNILAYARPMVLLTDTFSASSADAFAAVFQDNDLGLLIGTRTNGAGGTILGLPAGAWSEGTITVTRALQARRAPVSVEGYPTTRRIENVGVHPDIVLDYMTRENLVTNGAPFVREFLARAAEHIRSRQ